MESALIYVQNLERVFVPREQQLGPGGRPGQSSCYSATASFSITTFKCAVTSLCSLTGTLNSPTVFRGSCNWILRRSTLKPFLVSASPISLEVTDPKS